MNNQPIDHHDFDKDPSYLWRRNWLLNRMKKTNWDEVDEDEYVSPVKQPKQQPIVKGQNKFFNFNDEKS